MMPFLDPVTVKPEDQRQPVGYDAARVERLAASG